MLSQYKMLSINNVENQNVFSAVVIIALLTNAFLRFICPLSMDKAFEFKWINEAIVGI